jgi:D-alanyl-lipoteichoic acid acyltransferase DltB (MBOAT superfamily)
MLGVFKYFNFFAHNAVTALQALGLTVSYPQVSIALPVGISFFAFQGMSYVIDVHRGDIRARKNLIDIALFKAFFPQLVAGPIERAAHFLPQLESQRRLRPGLVLDGLFLMLWGFFKKLVIADNVSIIANKVFLLEHPSFPVLWSGVFAFCIQIFADFSGYTDIARGTAKLFGIDLVENFREPYLAVSPVDFWRRWHISLSTWLRDYVYVPLGGNRGGRWCAARNVMITFLLSGLWHGAGWNYVLWGGYWGLLIILYNAVADRNEARASPLRAWLPLRIALMLCLTNFGWLMFRETDLHFLGRDLILRPDAASPLEWRAGIYFVCMTLLYATPLIAHMWVPWLRRALPGPLDGEGGTRLLMQSATAAALFTAILTLRTATSADFIYFQF